MTMIGTCHICGRPATTTCTMCGQLVCPVDSDPITRICRQCSRGTKMGRANKPRVGRVT